MENQRLAQRSIPLNLRFQSALALHILQNLRLLGLMLGNRSRWQSFTRNPSLYSPYGKPEVPGPIPYHQRSGFLKVNFCLGSSSNVFKYKNPHTGIWYVYDKKLRSALSFCDGSDIPEIYGISDWIEGIPEKEINMNTLISYYRIIGL